MKKKNDSLKSKPDFSIDKKIGENESEEPVIYKIGKTGRKKSPQMSRRGFLKGGITAGAGIAAAAGLPACGDMEDKDYDSESGSQTETRYYFDHETDVLKVAFNSDGSNLASAGTAEVKIWDTLTGDLLLTFNNHDSEVTGLVFSSDSKVVSADRGGTVYIWDSLTGSVNETFIYSNLINDIDIYGNEVAIACNKSEIEFLNISDKSTSTIATSASENYCVCFNPDGNYIASSGDDQNVYIINRSDGTIVTTITSHADNSNDVNSIAFNTSNTKIAAGSTQNVYVSNIDGTDTVFINRGANSLDYNDSLLAIAGSNQVDLYNENNNTFEYNTTHYHSLTVNSVKFCADGTSAASGQKSTYGSSSVHLWDITSGDLIKGGDYGEGSYSYCTCDQVCTCNTVCTCNSQGGGGGSTYYYPN